MPTIGVVIFMCCWFIGLAGILLAAYEFRRNAAISTAFPGFGIRVKRNTLPVSFERFKNRIREHRHFRLRRVSDELLILAPLDFTDATGVLLRVIARDVCDSTRVVIRAPIGIPVVPVALLIALDTTIVFETDAVRAVDIVLANLIPLAMLVGWHAAVVFVANRLMEMLVQSIDC